MKHTKVIFLIEKPGGIVTPAFPSPVYHLSNYKIKHYEKY